MRRPFSHILELFLLTFASTYAAAAGKKFNNIFLIVCFDLTWRYAGSNNKIFEPINTAATKEIAPKADLTDHAYLITALLIIILDLVPRSQTCRLYLFRFHCIATHIYIYIYISQLMIIYHQPIYQLMIIIKVMIP